MFINRCYEKENDMIGNQGCVMTMMECPQERVCHMSTCHDVQHIVPINTKMVNHHVYKHSYVPMYTYSYEDVYDDMCDGINKNF